MISATGALAPSAGKRLNRRVVVEIVLMGGLLVLLLAAPAFLSDFRLNQMGKFLTFAIVAIGIDLLWGYTGMLSLGQGVFFGLGGYSMAMYLKLHASGQALPDFMTWSGVKELPWFWEPFHYWWVAIPLAALGPAIIAFLFGYVLFHSRVTGVYFSIVTQALAMILSIFLVGQQAYTGGTNGLTNYSDLFGATLRDPNTQQTLYFVTVGVLVMSYAFARWVTGSRLGRLMVAMRDDEARTRFTGYNIALVKAAVFAISAALAGIAGALFVPQVGIISPANLGVVPSIEMVLWVAVGGRGTLSGAVIGAIAVSWARSWLSESWPQTWLYFMGALFVASVVAFPRGLVGSLDSLISRVSEQRMWLRQRVTVEASQPSEASTAPPATAATTDAAPASSEPASPAPPGTGGRVPVAASTEATPGGPRGE